MLTGMFAADERVKKAETPDSRSTMKVSGYGLSCVATQTMKGLSTSATKAMAPSSTRRSCAYSSITWKPSVASVWDTRPKMPIGAKRITICTIEETADEASPSTMRVSSRDFLRIMPTATAQARMPM